MKELVANKKFNVDSYVDIYNEMPRDEKSKETRATIANAPREQLAKSFNIAQQVYVLIFKFLIQGNQKFAIPFSAKTSKDISSCKKDNVSFGRMEIFCKLNLYTLTDFELV